VSDALITVEKRGDTWSIEFNGKRFGAYRSEEAALWGAVAAAVKAKESGGQARVQLMEDGIGRTVWPKPPTGAERPAPRPMDDPSDEWGGLEQRTALVVAEKDNKTT
jgi:hypothetical protein